MILELLFAFIFGAIFGSFYGVVSQRFPMGEDLVYTRSKCDTCNQTLNFFDLIPIFSFLFLRGRCRYCNNSIDKNIFIIEILSGILFSVTYYIDGLSLAFFLHITIFSLLLILSIIDLKYKAVPYSLLVVIVILSLIPIAKDPIEQLRDFLLFCGGLFLLDFFVSFYIQNIKSKIFNDPSLYDQKALGEGDIPIAGVIGALLGIEFGIYAIFLAACFAILPSIYTTYKKQELELAFIPFLALGCFGAFLLKELL